MRVPLPPRLVRRVLIAPIVPLLAVLWLVSAPLVLPVAAYASHVLPGRLRAFRLVWLLLVWLVRESVGVVALFALWLASGFGWRLDRPWFREQHVQLIGWYLWGLVGAAQRSLGLRLVTEETPGALVVEPHISPEPVLVFSRHAGVGDSFLLAHELVNTYGRVPSVVLKDTLQWAPTIDIALNRLPNAFIPSDPPPGGGAVAAIGALAAELPEDGALILFPEGGNFTPGRRERALARLAERGLDSHLARAHELATVLPPRPGGVLAALDAAPDADVVLVAHTGLEPLSSVGSVLTRLPMAHSVRMAWWLVPRHEIPTTAADRVDWLYHWWERIDSWIEAHVEPGLDPRTRLGPEGPAHTADI